MDTYDHSHSAARLFLVYGTTAFCCTLSLLMITSPPPLIVELGSLAWLQMLAFSNKLQALAVWLMTAEQVHLPIGLVAVGLISAWLSHRWTLRALTRDYQLTPLPTNSEFASANERTPAHLTSSLDVRPTGKAAAIKSGNNKTRSRESVWKSKSVTARKFDSPNKPQPSNKSVLVSPPNNHCEENQHKQESRIKKPILQYLKVG